MDKIKNWYNLHKKEILVGILKIILILVVCPLIMFYVLSFEGLFKRFMSIPIWVIFASFFYFLFLVSVPIILAKYEKFNTLWVISYFEKFITKTSLIYVGIAGVIYAPFIAEKISLFYGKDKIVNSNDWFSFLATYFGIIASIILVYWQVKRNEDKKKEEENNKRNEEMNNVITYITHCLENSASLEDEKTIGIFGFPLKYAHILFLKHTDVNKTKRFFYEFDKDYISRNIEKILTLKQGEKILEINDEIFYLNELIYKNIDYFNIFEIKNDLAILIERHRLTQNTNDGFFVILIERHLALINELVFVYGEEFKSSNWNSLLNDIRNFTQTKRVPTGNKIVFDEFEKYLLEAIKQRSDYILEIYVKQLDMLYSLINSMYSEFSVGLLNSFDLKDLNKKILAEKLLMNQLRRKVPALLIDIINVKRELKKIST